MFQSQFSGSDISCWAMVATSAEIMPKMVWICDNPSLTASPPATCVILTKRIIARRGGPDQRRAGGWSTSDGIIPGRLPRGGYLQ